MNNTITETEINEDKKINKYAGRYTGRYTGRYKETAKKCYENNKEKRLLYRKERYELKKTEINEKAKILYSNGKLAQKTLNDLTARILELEKLTVK